MKIGFIGCGNMASAMISGMLKKGLYKKDEIIVSNLTEEGSKRSREKLGVVTTLDNHEVVKNTKLVFLAVKPQFYEEVLNEVKGELTPEHTVVGIAPGKTLAWLEEKCGQPLKVVRMMPNTPAQVGEGMTGVCANEKVSAEELAQICEITDSFGRTEVVPERLMDAVSAVSGCSPAYVFMFIEGNGRCCGSPGNAKKTGLSVCCTGSSRKRKDGSGYRKTSWRIKDMVCSPAGTTIEAVRTLEELGFRSSIIEAMKVCEEMSRSL